jgi:hypothetical protein
VCKPGDWLVSNDGDTHSVDHESFARTYQATGPGMYVKITPVWAEVARAAGEVRTKESGDSQRPRPRYFRVILEQNLSS